MENDLEKLVRILSEVALLPIGQIASHSDIFDDLGIDSLALMDTLVKIETEFGIQIPPAALSRAEIRTPKDLLVRIHYFRKKYVPDA